ncbi:MAG: SDR family NAD(P)-dependent oxidoreductase [Salinivirgaceae bacterium]|nr:SDR family NAD(P)-dependent oxidoreductase [Salinivirgaceae bacterium]
MYTNYIFSGYGFVTGKYEVSNKDIDKAIDDGFFVGLDKERIKHSEKYKALLKKYPQASPFDYMAEHMMGFRKRFHVVPFPPRKENYTSAETSLDLLVAAIQQAFDDSGVHPEDIAAWIVGTATPHEMAPGIAETAKCYFTKMENRTQTMTTSSACVGFNINIERALNFLKTHPEAKHIVVAQTEVMSELLLEEKDFVPFTTFGDGSAAVIVSRVVSDKKEGLLDVVNYEDMAMIDFLGADRDGNLIMDPRRVKGRAVPNIASSAKEIMEKANWKLEDVDLFIPHQTGNAIVHEAAEKLNFPLEKVFQEIQLDYGNLSGSSIPACFHLLKSSKRLKPGMKIITATTGLGGELGAFSYVVPIFKKFEAKNNDLEGKTALVTGCTGGLGGEISRQLAEKGCRVLMHYNSNREKATSLLDSLANQALNHKIIKANFSNDSEIESLIDTVKVEVPALNYLVHTVAVTGSLNKASEVSDEEMRFVDKVNYTNAAKLTEALTEILNGTVIFTGSIAQDAQFSGSSAYVSSKCGLYGFAAGYARLNYPKVKCVYYIPGIIDGGMTAVLNQAQINASMMAVGQDQLIPLNDIASRMVKSLYIPKVAKVRSHYDGVLVVRKDGYKKY